MSSFPSSTSPRRSTGPCTLADLTADLVWPKLLRAGHLALRPARMGLAFVLVVGLVILFALANRIDGDPEHNRLAVTAQVVLVDLIPAHVVGETVQQWAVRYGGNLFDAFVSEPAYAITHHPWMVVIALPLILVWTCVLGGAISRSAACEFAQGVMLEWPRALGFGLTKWLSLSMSVLIPRALIWGIALGMAIAGWVLFSLPVVNVVGAVVWPLFLLGGLVIAVAAIAYLAGLPMLVPSVACEGTDAVDAVQHAYSFVLGRPLRLVVYVVILVVQGVLLFALVSLVVALAMIAAQKCAMALAGQQRVEDVLGHLPGLQEGAGPELAGSSRLARGIVWIWSLVMAALPYAFGVSYFWCASTMLYLAMRRVVDGQDMQEIWMPGVVEGTMARVEMGAAVAAPEVVGDAE